MAASLDLSLRCKDYRKGGKKCRQGKSLKCQNKVIWRHSGARVSANPESRASSSLDSGLEANGSAQSAAQPRPGMTGNASVRPDPVAMKTVGHAMPELHQRHRAGFN